MLKIDSEENLRSLHQKGSAAADKLHEAVAIYLAISPHPLTERLSDFEISQIIRFALDFKQAILHINNPLDRDEFEIGIGTSNDRAALFVRRQLLDSEAKLHECPYNTGLIRQDTFQKVIVPDFHLRARTLDREKPYLSIVGRHWLPKDLRPPVELVLPRRRAI